MKTFRFIIKVLFLIVFLGFTIGIFYKQNEFDIITAISLFVLFLIELVYNLIERQTDVLIISTKNVRNHRTNSLILLSFALLSAFVHFYNNELSIRLLMPSIIFGFLALRVLLFTKQTIVPIRVFDQGLEYGFWQIYTDWDKIVGYTVNNEENEIRIKKTGFLYNNVTIKFSNNSDLILFTDVLVRKNIKNIA